MPKPHMSVIFALMNENNRLNTSVKVVNDLLESLHKKLDERNELGRILLNEIKVLSKDILCGAIKVSQKTCELGRVYQYLKTLEGLDQPGLLRKLGDECWAEENKMLVPALNNALDKFLKEPLVDSKEKVSKGVQRAKL